MKIAQVAAQLYTLRDYLKTPADIVASLRKVRAIGYQAVQVSALGPIPDVELKKILRDEGLVCCATHEKGDWILDRPQEVVDHLRALDCTITAYPYPAGIRFDSVENVIAFARRLDAAGKVFSDHGQILCYHNHQIEFARLGGRIALEIIYDNTDPRHLQGEPDTYWVQYGGGDPVAWCERLHSRLPILHLKDYAVLPDGKVTHTEIGNGNLDWPRIIAAAEKSGCRWFAVEQDTCPGDPFESLRQSFHFIQENLC